MHKYISSIKWKIILISIGLGILFWIIDSFVDVFIFSDGTLVSQLFTPGPYEIYVRLLTMSLLLFFGFISQHLISRYMQAGELLRESEKRYRTLAEAAQDMIFIIDRNDYVQYVNTIAAKQFGCRPEELIGRKRGELFPPEVSLRQQQRLQEVFETGKAIYIEDKIVFPDNELWIGASLVPINNEAGEVNAVMGVSRDITKRKQAEESIKEGSALLEAINRTQSQFIIDTEPAVIFNTILDSLLSLTQSRYGFIGEILFTAEGKPYLKTHAITDIAWNEETRSSYEKYAPNMEFYNLKTLFGEVMTTGKPVISNNPSTDPRRGGLPEGHPSLDCFLGMPFYYGNNMVGMAGIANRPDGYDEKVTAFLQPLLITCGNIIEAYRNNERRKQAEDEINNILRQQKAILNNISDIAWLKDGESRFIAVNEPFSKACGVKPEDLVGKTDLDIWPMELAERYRSDDREVMASGKRKSVEEPLADKEGKIAWIETIKTPIYNENGDVIGTTGIARDITERKRLEEKLFQITHDWEDTFNTINDMITVHDKDFNIIHANKAAEKILGLPFLDVSPTKCYRYYHGTEGPPEGCPSCECLKTGVSSVNEIYEPHLKMFIEIRAIPRFDSSNNLIGLIHVVRDITERRKLEDQLRQSQKMEAIGQLAGGIAHDFNNILTAVIGYANILKMKMGKDDPLKINLDQILAASEKGANLTQSLLAFSRQQISNPEPVNVNGIIRSIEKLLLRVIGEDIELKTILNPPTPPLQKGGEGGFGDLTVMADQIQIDQVLINLCTNARDAMPDGGVLTIETGLMELDRDFVTAYGYGKPGTYAVISVSDTGLGIEEKIKERIFEPFFTTKEVGKGTGLGLSIVYGIIKQHNGYITCYSEVNSGSTFKIYLPIIKSEVAEIKSERLPELTAETATILLAEDEPEVRKLYKQVLEDSGFKVIEAVDGEDAVNKFIKNKDGIDLLILDIIMPKMNGKEVYDRIRKIKPDIKALLTSGYPADFIQKQEIIRRGIDFVAKPVSPSGLLKSMKEALWK